MDEIPILSADDASHTLKRFMGQYDVPAYIRRARGVQDAFDQLVARCRGQRDEWLLMPRLWLGRLNGLAGSWSALGELLADADQLAILERLCAELQPKLRCPVARSASVSVWRQALRDLCESLDRFNRRWTDFLQNLDLGPVNEKIDAYNRYYLVEKECVFHSARIARLGYQPLPPVTAARIAEVLPLLPVPDLK